jgi:hypothetical protein
MSSGKKVGVLVAVLALLGGVAYGFGVWPFAEKEKRAPIEIVKNEPAPSEREPVEDTGPVSPITGLPCENWNRRPIAVMQPRIGKRDRPPGSHRRIWSLKFRHPPLI